MLEEVILQVEEHVALEVGLAAGRARRPIKGLDGYGFAVRALIGKLHGHLLICLLGREPQVQIAIVELGRRTVAHLLAAHEQVPRGDGAVEVGVRVSGIEGLQISGQVDGDGHHLLVLDGSDRAVVGLGERAVGDAIEAVVAVRALAHIDGAAGDNDRGCHGGVGVSARAGLGAGATDVVAPGIAEVRAARGNHGTAGNEDGVVAVVAVLAIAVAPASEAVAVLAAV